MKTIQYPFPRSSVKIKDVNKESAHNVKRTINDIIFKSFVATRDHATHSTMHLPGAVFISLYLCGVLLNAVPTCTKMFRPRKTVNLVQDSRSIVGPREDSAGERSRNSAYFGIRTGSRRHDTFSALGARPGSQVRRSKCCQLCATFGAKVSRDSNLNSGECGDG